MSLRNRVTLASVAVLGIGLAIVGVALNLVLTNRLSADASSVLRERAASRLATLDTSGPRVAVHDAGGDAILDQQAWIFDRDGRIVERPPGDGRELATARTLSRVTAPRERSIDERARLLGVPAYDEQLRRVGSVVVGISLGPYERTEHLVAAGTVLLSLLVLAASALLARRAVDAALRPVASMTSQAARWGERDLHRRFDLGPPRDELTALAATLDGLLGRLDAGLRHEQRFSAEVAHELRTPLSGLRAEAELALRGRRTDRELRAALERVLAATDRMSAVIDTLLAAARNEATGPSGSSDAAATIRQIAGPGIEVIAPPGAVTVGADEDLLLAAVQPLLENALRHRARRARGGAPSGRGGDHRGRRRRPRRPRGGCRADLRSRLQQRRRGRPRARAVTPAGAWRGRRGRRRRVALRAAAPEHRPALVRNSSGGPREAARHDTTTRRMLDKVPEVTLFLVINDNLGFGLTWTTVVTGVPLVALLAVLTDRFSVSLVITTAVFTLALAATFAAWYRRERTLSIHTIVTTRREGLYWLAIRFTFALGDRTPPELAPAA